MEVVTFHVGSECLYAPIMIKTARRYGYTITFLTDEETPVPDGVDHVVRIPWDGKELMVYRLKHLAEFPRDACFVDTDVVFRKDVRAVMDREFSVALTRRREVILDPNGVNLTERMPFNAGVMFSKDREFWQRAYQASAMLNPAAKDWYGDQLAIAHVATGYPGLLELECSEFNHSPNSRFEDLTGRAIVHYKGRRKDWMFDWRGE